MHQVDDRLVLQLERPGLRVHAHVAVGGSSVQILLDGKLRLRGEALPGHALVRRRGRLHDEDEVARCDDVVIESDGQVEADHFVCWLWRRGEI